MKITKSKTKKLKCNLCEDGLMPLTTLTKEGHKTYVWICEECPMMSFEYYSQKDLDLLNEYQGGC